MKPPTAHPLLNEPVRVTLDPPTPAPSTETGHVLLCPGQGAQHVGMGRLWAQAHPIARRTFDHADELLNMPLSKLCFEGPAEQLNRTDVAQAAIYVTTVAAHRALTATGQIGSAAATAGLSLGEFTALHLAGAFDFATGLKLVRLRGEAMQAASAAQAGGMVAIISVDEAKVEDLCLKVLDRVAPEHRLLVPANFNCPRQIVVSGSQQACETTLVVAQEMGVAAKALPVAGAFHSPIMAPAARRLAQALDATDWSTPTVPVLSNVTGAPHDTANIESIKGLLVEQLTRPVRWEASMRWLTDHMPSHEQLPYAELPPGNVLSGLMRRIERKTKVLSFAEPA